MYIFFILSVVTLYFSLGSTIAATINTSRNMFAINASSWLPDTWQFREDVIKVDHVYFTLIQQPTAPSGWATAQ